MTTYHRKCQHCKKEYFAKNIRSKYCGDICRTKAYRKRKGYTLANLLDKTEDKNLPQKSAKENVSGYGVIEGALGVAAVNAATNLLTSKDSKPMTRGELVEISNYIILTLHNIQDRIAKLEQTRTF